LDNQKDELIKEMFQKDDLISKKADDMFNNFLKGEVEMNKEEKVVNIEKGSKKLKRKKLIAVAASLMDMLQQKDITMCSLW